MHLAVHYVLQLVPPPVRQVLRSVAVVCAPNEVLADVRTCDMRSFVIRLVAP
jgi:hypothetical protein